MSQDEPIQHVFRDLIEEHRSDYSVSYQPADVRSAVAVLSLFFPEASAKNEPSIRKAMEVEMEGWLKRFPVPIKVSAFNANKRAIRFAPNSGEAHLMGYVRLFDSAIVRRWGLIGEENLPADTKDPAHLEEAYKKIPFRVREEEREMARVEFRNKVKSFSLAVLLVLVLPALLQAVLYWGQQLAIPLMLACVVIGLFRLSLTMGWRKPFGYERRKAELTYRKDHCFYHCQKNPTAFARLEEANQRREVSKENKEARIVVQTVVARRKKRRQNWIFLPRLFRPKTS